MAYGFRLVVSWCQVRDARGRVDPRLPMTRGPRSREGVAACSTLLLVHIYGRSPPRGNGRSHSLSRPLLFSKGKYLIFSDEETDKNRF